MWRSSTSCHCDRQKHLFTSKCEVEIIKEILMCNDKPAINIGDNFDEKPICNICKRVSSLEVDVRAIASLLVLSGQIIDSKEDRKPNSQPSKKGAPPFPVV